jgi:hypothetical protein
MTTTMRCGAWATVFTVVFACRGAAQVLPAAIDDRIPTIRIQVWGDTVTEFTTKTNGYVEQRGRLESGLPALTVTDDPRQIRRWQRSLADGIRLARRGARRGDFFTASTSVQFRLVLAGIMNPSLWAVIMDENPGKFGHDIDEAYPEGKTFATVPTIVLARLPQLPDDVQFRFIGPDLILYDAKADTIIDRLPQAIQCVRCDD